MSQYLGGDDMENLGCVTSARRRSQAGGGDGESSGHVRDGGEVQGQGQLGGGGVTASEGEAGGEGGEGGEAEPPAGGQARGVQGEGEATGLVDGGALVTIPPLPEVMRGRKVGEREMIKDFFLPLLPIVADQEQVQEAVRDAVGEVLDGRVRPEIPGPAHNVPADADGWGLIDQLGAWDCMEVWVEAIWYCSCLVLRMRKEPSLHFQIVPKIGNYIHFVESNSVVIFLRLSLLSS